MAVKKTKSGTVDKRTKEGKAIAERMERLVQRRIV